MTQPNSHTGLAYRPDIDGLRAIAVLSVLFCHAQLSFPGGFIGVDVFFVISGYLITGLILKDLRMNRFSMPEFWERRVRRILPALAATMTATLAAAWFVTLPDDFVGLAKSAMAVSLLSANIFFWRDIDYFAQIAEEKPLLHTWSLAVEEQFYLFVPFALALLWRLWRGKHLFTSIALATVASFLLSALLPPFRADANFYLLPTRAWELFAGSLLAIRPHTGSGLGRLPRNLCGILGLACILVPCFMYHKDTPFPGLAAAPPVIGAILIIICGTGDPNTLVSRILASRPMVFIGLISYSLYLWHWPLLAFVRYLSVEPPGFWLRVALAAASVPMAILSWKFIETPFRKRRLFASRASALTAGAATLAGFTLIGGLIWMNEGYEGRLPAIAQKFERTGGEKTRFRFDYHPDKIPESLHKLGVIDGPEPSVLVWGDSFSMSFMPVADEVLREKGLSGLGAGYAAIAPVLDYQLKTTGESMDGASANNEAVFRYLSKNRIQTVWLVACWQAHIDVGGEPFVDALKKTISRMREAGIQVCFVIDPPSYDFNVPRLLVRKAMRGESADGLGMPREDYDRQMRAVRNLAEELKGMGVSVMDPTNDLLDPAHPSRMAICDGNGSLYSDNSHLSRHGSMKLRPMIHRWFSDP